MRADKSAEGKVDVKVGTLMLLHPSFCSRQRRVYLYGHLPFRKDRDETK